MNDNTARLLHEIHHINMSFVSVVVVITAAIAIATLIIIDHINKK